MRTFRKTSLSQPHSKSARPTPTCGTTTPTSKRKRTRVLAAHGHATVSLSKRATLIALSAYFRAERRGFTPGLKLEDWLAAEQEVDTLLAAAARSTSAGAR